MSSLSENDSDNEPQDSSNDSDNNSFGSEIRKDLSRITFENHGSPDSNSELLRLGLISQQSQSQLTTHTAIAVTVATVSAQRQPTISHS